MFLHRHILSFCPDLFIDHFRLLRSSDLVLASSAPFFCGSPQGDKMAASSFQNDVYLCSHLGKEFSQLLLRSLVPHTI